MIGKIISHYRIIEELGRGGMGVVYKAEDTKLKRTVALKFLPPQLIRDSEAKERFIREAQAASALEHNNICNIHEINETEEGRLFIAMACYEGETLKDKIKDKRLKIKDSIDIAIQIAQGLTKAHEQGIVHRDIKPANIMITKDGVVKILDFGLARLAGQTKLTKEGTTLGTIAYMSPEQARGDEIDARTDIWSLGIILYEMLTGTIPFKGEYDEAVIYSILNEEPKALDKLIDEVPGEIVKIVNRCMKKNQQERYKSAVEILKVLNRIKKGKGEKPFEPKVMFEKILRPRIAIPAILLLLLFIFIVIWIFNLRSKVQWAKYSAIPEILRLADERDWNAAYNLAKKVDEIIPENLMLIKIWPSITSIVPIKSEPEGAKVYRKFYTEFDAEWEYLG